MRCLSLRPQQLEREPCETGDDRNRGSNPQRQLRSAATLDHAHRRRHCDRDRRRLRRRAADRFVALEQRRRRQAQQRCVLAQVPSRVHRRTERLEAVRFERLDHPSVEMQILGGVLHRVAAALALRAQHPTRRVRPGCCRTRCTAGRLIHPGFRSDSSSSLVWAALGYSLFRRCA